MAYIPSTFSRCALSWYFSSVISGSFWTKDLEKKKGSHFLSLLGGGTFGIPWTKRRSVEMRWLFILIPSPPSRLSTWVHCSGMRGRPLLREGWLSTLSAGSGCWLRAFGSNSVSSSSMELLELESGFIWWFRFLACQTSVHF